MIDLITIVFQQELCLLEIQARSIERYIDSNRINKIFVVVNDRDKVCEQINLSWYGSNSRKVQVIPRSHWGHKETLPGWESQQLYKLLAAESADSEWSMCLDSKTWFVQPLNWNKLFTENNQVHFKTQPTIPVFATAETSLNKLLNIKLPGIIGPAGVPFMFHTSTVKEMFDHLQSITGKKFIDFFAEYLLVPYQITEFMLYSAFVYFKYQTFDSLYNPYQYYKVTNLADWQLDQFDKILSDMSDERNLTASIQGRAYPHLSDQQLNTWCQFLETRMLIDSTEETKNRLNILR